MSDLKTKTTAFQIGGTEYRLLFDLNAIDEIQDLLDVPISNLPDVLNDKQKSAKAVKQVLAILINEAIDAGQCGEQKVTPKSLGRELGYADIFRGGAAIMEAMFATFPKDENADPNQ